jgi:hypothetical protein
VTLAFERGMRGGRREGTGDHAAGGYGGGAGELHHLADQTQQELPRDKPASDRECAATNGPRSPRIQITARLFLEVDASNVALSDLLEIRVYTVTLSGGSTHLPAALHQRAGVGRGPLMGELAPGGMLGS